MTYVSVDVDIDLEDLVSRMTKWDIKKLIEILEVDGHLDQQTTFVKESSIKSAVELEFENALDKLKNNYMTMSNDDVDLIINLSKKRTMI